MKPHTLWLAIMAMGAVLPAAARAEDNCALSFIYAINQACALLSNGFTQCQPVGLVGPAPNCERAGLQPLMPVPLAPPTLQAPPALAQAGANHPPTGFGAPWGIPGAPSYAPGYMPFPPVYPGPYGMPGGSPNGLPLGLPYGAYVPRPLAPPGFTLLPGWPAPVATPSAAPGISAAAAVPPTPAAVDKPDAGDATPKVVLTEPSAEASPAASAAEPAQALVSPAEATVTPTPEVVEPRATAPLESGKSLPEPPSVEPKTAAPTLATTPVPPVALVEKPIPAPPPAPLPVPEAPAAEPLPVVEAAAPTVDPEAARKAREAEDALAHFAFDSAELTDLGKKELDAWLAQAAKDKSIRLTGHADRLGPSQYNMELSRRRAETVRKYLRDKGLAAKHIQVVAKGEQEQVIDCKGGPTPATKACLAPNRRVVIESE